MVSYFIANIRIQDDHEYEKYLEGYDEIFSKYKGEVIAVDDEPAILEGIWPYTRVVIIRFPNEHELRRWYDSEEYRSLAVHRKNASEADVLLIKGRK